MRLSYEQCIRSGGNRTAKDVYWRVLLHEHGNPNFDDQRQLLWYLIQRRVRITTPAFPLHAVRPIYGDLQPPYLHEARAARQAVRLCYRAPGTSITRADFKTWQDSLGHVFQDVSLVCAVMFVGGLLSVIAEPFA
jgi:hypothetical protein